jgi:hypothetical protein
MVQNILDAFYLEVPPNYEQGGLIAALRVFVDEVVPHEEEAPRAVFDCEPRPSYNFKTHKCDGPLHYDHSAHLRRQIKQDALNLKWEQRQQTRVMMLDIITKLEQFKCSHEEK